MDPGLVSGIALGARDPESSDPRAGSTSTRYWLMDPPLRPVRKRSSESRAERSEAATSLRGVCVGGGDGDGGDGVGGVVGVG